MTVRWFWVRRGSGESFWNYYGIHRLDLFGQFCFSLFPFRGLVDLCRGFFQSLRYCFGRTRLGLLCHGGPENEGPSQQGEPQKEHYDHYPETVVLVKEDSVHLFVLVQDEDEEASGPQTRYPRTHRCKSESKT